MICRHWRWLPLFLTTLLVVMAPQFSNADPERKVLLLSPDLNAGQDLNYLRKGVLDMLSVRLTSAGKTIVLTLDSSAASTPRNNAEALRQGQKMGVDFIVLQSLTILGNSVSTDARVLATASGQTVLTFSRTGKEQDDIISHIDELANQINVRLLGRSATTANQKTVTVPGPSVPAVPLSEPQPDIHQHPEKLLKGLGASQTEKMPQKTQKGAPLKNLGAATRPEGSLLLRSKGMDRQITGVTAGDVNGDGVPEVICIDSMTVMVFQLVQGQLRKFTEINAGNGNVGVDTADLNKNGFEEIFVTHFDDMDGRVYSYVLEWDGQALKRVAEGLRWYFRSVDLSDRGRVLVGQRQGFDALFSAGVYEMAYQAGTYEGVGKLNLPRKQNLFGFAQGAVTAAGESNLVGFSTDGYLRVSSTQGREEWSSVASFGSTANALISKSKEDPNEKDFFYLPSRIHLVDLDGDGQQEIVTARNEDAAGAFKRMRLFKNGRLEVLKWDQLGLKPAWQSDVLSKFIGDFTLVDLDGDHQPELVAAIVQKGKNMLNRGSSYLAVFKFS